MKIICIGRNYADHAKELGNTITEEPMFFCKPDSAILPKGNPFYLPEWSTNIHYEVELVVRINRLGKNIEERFASRYYDEIGLGIDFTARDVQDELKKKGHPWEKAKGFDGSAVICNDFIAVNEFDSLENISFSLKKNGEFVQKGNSRDMIHSIDKIISYVSQYMTLKIGDYIFTGTPVGVGQVIAGDVLEGFIGEQKMFGVKVK
jgi:2-keto-4-pentenoate hydratase/2-oxohepta-3-ene-1,7-dioic acid hydratase in catechol pathway